MDFSHWSAVSPSSIPQFIWACYVEYLWNYKSNSAVAKLAYTFRVLAVLLILPIVILTLLDIASYAIARTLGVVDVVKASTSDKQTVHTTFQPPSIHVREASLDNVDANMMESTRENARHRPPFFTLDDDSSRSTLAPESRTTPSDVPLTEYFTSEGNNFELSGVGVFSPASSRPSSPVISRRTLEPESSTPSLRNFELDDSVHLRRRNKLAMEPIAQ